MTSFDISLLVFIGAVLGIAVLGLWVGMMVTVIRAAGRYLERTDPRNRR